MSHARARGMIYKWGSTLKVSIGLLTRSGHHRDDRNIVVSGVKYKQTTLISSEKHMLWVLMNKYP